MTECIEISTPSITKNQCLLCKEYAVHYLQYLNLENDFTWDAGYCTKCFVLKLKGMARAWSNDLKKTKGAPSN